MTDREYLELAAKAARIEWADGHESTGLRNANGTFWNPLTDDGDALRLAVRLRFHARQFPLLDDGYDAPLGMVEVWRVDDDDPLHVEFLRNGDDRLAATRRAIVRAAAEIGKGMRLTPKPYTLFRSTTCANASPAGTAGATCPRKIRSMAFGFITRWINEKSTKREGN